MKNLNQTNCLITYMAGEDFGDFTNEIFGYISPSEALSITVFVKIDKVYNDSEMSCDFDLNVGSIA